MIYHLFRRHFRQLIKNSGNIIYYYKCQKLAAFEQRKWKSWEPGPWQWEQPGCVSLGLLLGQTPLISFGTGASEILTQHNPKWENPFPSFPMALLGLEVEAGVFLSTEVSFSSFSFQPQICELCITLAVILLLETYLMCSKLGRYRHCHLLFWIWNAFSIHSFPWIKPSWKCSL